MLSTLLPVGQTGRALKRLTVNLILLSLTHLFFGTFFPYWRRSKIHVGISRVRTETFLSHRNFLMRISSYLFVSQTVQNNLSWCSVAATSQRPPLLTRLGRTLTRADEALSAPRGDMKSACCRDNSSHSQRDQLH